MNEKKTILIAGASGFIGSHLLEELLSLDYEIIALVKGSLHDFRRLDPFISRIQVYDIETVDVGVPFSENNVDMVINLVTNYGRVKNTLLHEIIDTNVVFALKLAEKSVVNRVPFYFNIDSSLDPNVNLYSYSKSVCRNILENEFAKKNKIKVFNLKLANTYGENDDLSKFLPMAIHKLKNNEDIYMTKGEQKLDLVYVKDCVSAMSYIISNRKRYLENVENFEIGTGKAATLKSFIETVRRRLGSKSEVHYGAIDYRANDLMFFESDISKIDGWKPKYDVNNVDFEKF